MAVPDALVVDIEWDPANRDELLCIGWVWCGEATVSRTVTPELERLLVDPMVPTVQFTKADVRWLRLHDYRVEGDVYDLQVMAWVLDENQPLDLGNVTKRYLGYDPDKRLRRVGGKVMFRCDDGSWVPIGEAPYDQLAAYNGRDIGATDKLYRELWQRLDDSMWLDYYLNEEVEFTDVLLDMEVAGMPLNIDDSEQLRTELEDEVQGLDRVLRESAGLPASFNLNSGDQLSALLFSKRVELQDSLDWDPAAIECLKSCLAGEHEDCDLAVEDGYSTDPNDDSHHIRALLPEGFRLGSVGRTKVHGSWWLPGFDLAPTPPTKSGRPSVSAPMLRVTHAGQEWVEQLLDLKKRQKVITTYLRPFAERVQDGRIYGRFNQTGTKTGRLSSSDPNLQNIPARGDLGKRVRSLFQGDLLVGDYSQLEPRLMAHFSGDPVLMDAYRTGKDVYMLTARHIFGPNVSEDGEERGISKTVVLGSQYGAGAEKLAIILALNGYPTPTDRAAEYLYELQRLYAVLWDWKDAVMRFAHQHGYVRTLAGRHRRLRYQFESRNWKNIGYGERQAVNAVVQGSAGDVVRRTMLKWPWHLDRRHSEHLRLLAQVHDELVWEYDGTVGACVMCELHDEYEMAERACVLSGLRSCAETGHGFDLRVPLVFEPHFGRSWYSAKQGGDSYIELPEEDEDEAA